MPPTGLLTLLPGLRLRGPRFVTDEGPVEDWIPDEGGGYRSSARPDARLALDVEAARGLELVRFRYRLSAPGRLVKPRGVEDLRWLALDAPFASLTEVALAHYEPVSHVYRPGETLYERDELPEGRELSGPIVVLHGESGGRGAATLLAFEHGGDHPQPFLLWHPTEAGIELRAGVGNTLDRQPAELASVWLHVARAEGIEALREGYRRYLLDEHGPREPRRPRIFANTWNHQERGKYLKDQPYLAEMNLERMLAEIDVAHEIGVETFVVDTGWYAKTGDWEVNPERFPDGLREVRARLEGYGMRLGLWFDPTVAARTSRAYLDHPEWTLERGGEPDFRGPIWETEESYGLCLVSGWSERFAETLIRLNRELGVSYFKLDGVGQRGCDSARHDHGDASHSPQERADRYAFESGRRLTEIAARVARECPGAVVDFDVTERGRFFGLGFLAGGKFFTVNNGPYYRDFDIPAEYRREPETINVFFHPGPARGRVCRAGYALDRWIPSTLSLVHGLPDGDEIARENALASLVLGGNGLWGSLPELTPEERAFWRERLALYREVRDDAARASPRVVGSVGTSPEVHEKLDRETGCGVVALFAHKAGRYVHVTRPLARAPGRIVGADASRPLPNGRVEIAVELPRDGARTVFFLPTPASGADRG